MAVVAPVLGAPPLRRFSPPEAVRGVTPSAGANFTQEIDDGKWWRLLSLFVRLNTDANVAARTLRIEYRNDEGALLHVNGNPVTYPASTTNEDFSFSVWHPRGEWEVATTNLVPLAPMLLQPAWDFRVAVNNIQAGDTLTLIRFVVEKFYPPDSSEFDYPP